MVTFLMVVAGLALAVGAGLWLFWRAWLKLEEDRQHERLRQVVNGGGADMPRWMVLRERRRRWNG